MAACVPHLLGHTQVVLIGICCAPLSEELLHVYYKLRQQLLGASQLQALPQLQNLYFFFHFRRSCKLERTHYCTFEFLIPKLPFGLDREAEIAKNCLLKKLITCSYKSCLCWDKPIALSVRNSITILSGKLIPCSTYLLPKVSKTIEKEHYSFKLD